MKYLLSKNNIEIPELLSQEIKDCKNNKQIIKILKKYNLRLEDFDFYETTTEDEFRLRTNLISDDKKELEFYKRAKKLN